MMEVVQCLATIVFYLIVFAVMGYLISNLIKYKAVWIEYLFLGFFGYFALFQGVALPLILMKKPLTLLVQIWLAVLAVITITFFVVLYRNKKVSKEQKRESVGSVVRTIIQNPYLFLYAALVLFVCYFTMIQNYWGWDTAYYIGTVSTTVDTNTMYQFSGETGRPLGAIPFRYALSSFYMNSAVFCKVTGIAPVMFQKYVMGILCVLLYHIVLYLIGKEVFFGKSQKAFLFAFVAGALNFFFVSEFTTAQFLLFRSYEAKGYCANVMIPAVLWALIRIHRELENRENWRLLSLLMLASVPISMSSILIVPAIVVIALLAETIVNRKVKVIGYGMVCLIPNVIYLVVYFLHTIDVFVIKV